MLSQIESPRLSYDPSQSDELEDNYFDEILEKKIKSGKSQIIFSSALSMLWLADGCEMQVLGFVLPVVQKEWDLGDFQTNLIGSSVFLFWGLSAILTGRLADKFGRRLPMLISSFGQGVTALMSAFCYNYTQLIIIRAGFGFFLGLGNPLTASYLSEIVPRQKRGLYFSVVFNMFVFGEMMTVFLAYLCLENLHTGNWRLLLGLTSIPGIVAFIISYFYLIESPRYLLVSQNEINCKEHCYELLDQMGKVNNNNKSNNFQDQYQELTFQEKQKLSTWADQQHQGQNQFKGGLIKIFEGDYLKLTLKTMIMWFSLSFIYYGIVFQLPTMLFKIHREQGIQVNSQNQGDFIGIFIAAAVECPSNLVAYFMLERKEFGRKFALQWSYVICACCCILVYLHPNDDQFFYFLVATVKFFINIAFLVCFAFTSEIYPTSMRSTGVGFNNSICRFGGVLMPFLSLLFYAFGNTGPFLCCGIMSILSAIAAFLIPSDTRNIVLDTYVELKNLKQKE